MPKYFKYEVSQICRYQEVKIRLKVILRVYMDAKAVVLQIIEAQECTSQKLHFGDIWEFIVS